MDRIEKFIHETITRAARRANRRSYGGLEEGDVAGALWQKVLPLRNDPDKWNEKYLSVVIWRNAFGHHHRKVEPIPLIDGVESRLERPTKDYIDLHNLISEIDDEDTRIAAELYCNGDSIDTIALTLETTKPRINNLLVSAKRQLRSAISKLPLRDQDALRNAN